jgi:hypothetical protein
LAGDPQSDRALRGGSHDVLDQLLEASRRGSVGTAQMMVMVDAVAGSLHDVYVVAPCWRR